MADKSVKLSTTSFRDIPICELCLEDALKAGAAKTGQLKPQDLKETSLRFCVNGLYKCLKSFARHYGETSAFTMIRDLSWYWASFCSTDETMVELVREYDSLLKDMTEHTDFTDLWDRMDDQLPVKERGWAGSSFNVSVPHTTWGAIHDCAVALGTSFSVFYQVGLSKAMASDSKSLYVAWAATVFAPLYSEFLERAKIRLGSLQEIRHLVEYRQAKNG